MSQPKITWFGAVSKPSSGLRKCALLAAHRPISSWAWSAAREALGWGCTGDAPAEREGKTRVSRCSGGAPADARVLKHETRYKTHVPTMQPSRRRVRTEYSLRRGARRDANEP
eukprot:scaffold536_cov409-Prasinococcus_capsulatus_cf.AAC.8